MANAPEMLRLLAADGPHAAVGDAAGVLGRLGGSWDLEMAAYARDGERERYVGEWHFGWVLQGRAVQDVLITRTSSGEVIGYGSTIRSFHAERGIWTVVWQDPMAGEFAVLVGKPERDRMVLDGRWRITGAHHFRWTFFDVTPDTFEWSGEESDDEGASWWLAQRISARRRS